MDARDYLGFADVEVVADIGQNLPRWFAVDLEQV